MKVFLVWSGEASHILADGLRTWLPKVIQGIRPFLSSRDIRSGSRWNEEIGGELQEANYGILCLTRQNLEATWIHFEAGALSKAVERSHVVPLLLDVDGAQLQPPISEFQWKAVSKDDMRSLVLDINQSIESPLDDQLLAESFEMWWPQFQEVLEAARAAIGQDADAENERSPGEIRNETLELCRSISRGVATLGHTMKRQGPALGYPSWLPTGTRGEHGNALRYGALSQTPLALQAAAEIQAEAAKKAASDDSEQVSDDDDENPA